MAKMWKNHGIDKNLIQNRKKMPKCNLLGQITLPPTRTQADDAAFPLGSGNGKSKTRTFDHAMAKMWKNHDIDQNLIQARKNMT